MVDTDALTADVEGIRENGGDYRDVPHGTYEVEVDKLELIESKKGDPMVTAWFKVLDGEHKGGRIFMNQVVTRPFQIHLANVLLRQLAAELPDVVVKFESYKRYGELIADIREAIDGAFEYALDYAEGRNGFSTFEIREVYVLE